MTEWYNYVVPDINSDMTTGHLKAETLEDIIQRRAAIEGYHSVFDLEARPTFKGYQGIMRPALGLIFFDFDGDDGQHEEAFTQAKDFVLWLGVKDVHISFSGNRGFHIGVPQEYLGLGPSADLASRLKKLCNRLQEKYDCLDDSIYSAAHKIRVSGSKHPKSQLYKMYLNYEDFFTMSLTEIKTKAATDRGELKLNGSGPSPTRAPLQQLVELLSKVQEKKELVITDEDTFAPFKTWDQKPCIEKLFEKRVGTGARHEVALILASDLYHTGHHLKDAEAKLLAWCAANGLASENREGEIIRGLHAIYSGTSKYSYGCNNTHKAKWCSAKCAIYPKLNRETRPQPLDAPYEYSKPFAQLPELKVENTQKQIRNKLNLQKLSDLMTQPDPEYDWLIKDLLIKSGTSSLSGAPKSGKSTLSRKLCLAIAKGEPFFGRQTTKGKIVYIAVEEKVPQVKRHFKDLACDGAEEIYIHAAYTPEKLPEQLIEVCKTIKPDLIVCDTFQKTTGCTDLNDAVKINQAMAPFHDISIDYDTHILFITHLSKGKGGAEAISGSVALRGAFDCNMLLESGEKKKKRRVFYSEQRYGVDFEPHTVDFDEATRNPTLGTAVRDSAIQETLEEIITHIRDMGEECSSNMMYKEVKGKKTYYLKALKLGVSKGYLKERKDKQKKFYDVTNDAPPEEGAEF